MVTDSLTLSLAPLRGDLSLAPLRGDLSLAPLRGDLSLALLRGDLSLAALLGDVPFFPGRAPRPDGSAASPGRAGARRRWPRVPAVLSPAGGKNRRGTRCARTTERYLSRLARRGQRIELGTPEQPYEPLAQGWPPLAALRRFDGLAVTITTRSSEILEQLDLLVELDRRHTVAVDVLIASLEPGSVDLEERLRAVSALSSHGITSRLLLTDLPDLPLSAGAACSIRQLFEAARDRRAFDVVAVPCGVAGEEWLRLVRYLRLEMGFPRSAPGRG